MLIFVTVCKYDTVKKKKITYTRYVKNRKKLKLVLLKCKKGKERKSSKKKRERKLIMNLHL